MNVKLSLNSGDLYSEQQSFSVPKVAFPLNAAVSFIHTRG